MILLMILEKICGDSLAFMRIVMVTLAKWIIFSHLYEIEVSQSWCFEKMMVGLDVIALGAFSLMNC